MSELLDLRMELRRIAQALESANELHEESINLTRRLVQLREEEVARNLVAERRWVVSQRKLHAEGCEVPEDMPWVPCACPVETTEKRGF